MKKLFVISYSHTFAQGLEIKRLVDRLNNLGVNDYAEIWWDYEIPSGSIWDKEIRDKLEMAAGYFVLGSKSYIESAYIRQVEWPIIERKAKSGAAKLFWTSFDYPVESYPPEVYLSYFQTAAGRNTPLNQVDTQKKKNDFLTQLAEEIAAFLVTDSEPLSFIDLPKREPTSREIEAAYLETLRSQCAEIVSRDRFLPMQQLYVRLKADERTTEEIMAGEELIKRRIQAEIADIRFDTSKKTADQIIEEQLKQLKEVEQLPTEATARFVTGNLSDDSLEGIFQRNRFLVVRGGPGSGKTVLCWKITEQMLAGWTEEFELRQVKSIRRMTEFGTTRLPILIPIRDYAKACREHDGNLTLAGFIGNHLLREDPVNAVYFNRFLIKQIEDGRTVILLDGLDEVPAMDRHRIVDSIQIFLRTYINPTLDKFFGDPGDIGGNQMVITSRLAGYELAPVTDKAFKHFIIRPFDEKGIEDYCRNWAEMVFRPRTPNYGGMADRLVAIILRDSNPTVRELAKNPLLLQVLCELTAPVDVLDDLLPEDSLNELPRIRAEIYERAITVMANRWKLAYESVAEKNDYVKRLLEPGKIEELLSYIALEMQRNEVLTRATREQLRGWLEIALGKLEGKPVMLMPAAEVTQTISALLNLIRTHVGVISESAPGVFQFHHLTFQEYLAGRASCRTYNGKSWETAAKIGELLASVDKGLLSQRWREPLLLAFGYLGIRAKTDEAAPKPAEVMKALLTVWEKEGSDITPEEVALLSTSLLLELPDDLILELMGPIISNLVACYSTWFGSGASRETVKFFIQPLVNLRRRLTSQSGSDGNNPFDIEAANIIENDSVLRAPLARIFVDRGWLTPPILLVFAKARVHDQEAWEWPLHQGLRRAVLEKEDLEPRVLANLSAPDASESIQKRINYDRALDVWREQKRADDERVARPELFKVPEIQHVLNSAGAIRNQSPATLRMLIALCGGFSDFQCSRWIKEYADMAVFLQQQDAIRENRINEAPEIFLPRWGGEDVVYNMAVYLDTQQGGRRSLVNEPVNFMTENISHDPSETLLPVLKALITGESDKKIVKLLRQIVALDNEAEIAAEAWIALLAIGQAPPFPGNSVFAEHIYWHCGRIVDELRDVVVRFAHRSKGNNESKKKADQTETGENIWSILAQWLPTLPEPEAVTIFRFVMEALIEATGEPVKPELKWKGAPNSPMNLAIWGEAWAVLLCGRSDDATYNLAVGLDTMKFASEPIEIFRQCEAIIKSANIRFAPGVDGTLIAPPRFDSNLAAINYFCAVVQFLCETSGMHDPRLGAALFDEITSDLFKAREDLPPMIILLAAYLDALNEDGFSMSPEEFERLLEMFSAIDEVEFHLADKWKLAELLSNDDTALSVSSRSHFDIIADICRLDNLSYTDEWKAFTIFLAANVIKKLDNKLGSREDIWLQLQSDVQAEAKTLSQTLATLLTRAEDGRLTMNKTVTRVVEAIAFINSKTARDVLSCVVPLISSTTPSEIPVLRSWIEKKWQRNISDQTVIFLSRHAALLMFEHNPIPEPSWVRPTFDLTEYGDDGSRARAVFALRGPISDIKRGIRKQSVSALGFDVLKEIIDYCIEKPQEQFKYFDDVDFDDPNVIDWLNSYSHQALKDYSVLHYIFGWGTWTYEVLEAFADSLIKGSISWNDAFIIGYGILVYHQNGVIPVSLHNIIREKAVSNKVTAYLLPETESYKMVVDVGLRAIAELGLTKPHDRASSILRADCLSINAGHWANSFGFAEVCADIAASDLQWQDTTPEDCWEYVEKHFDDDRLFELFFYWLVKELDTFLQRLSLGNFPVEPCDVYSTSLRNALLSVLCVMSERKRDELALLTADLEEQGVRFSTLLLDAAIPYGKLRSRVAAVTLLSRLPGLNATEISKIMPQALGADEQMRNRTLLLLPRFRDFEISESFIDEIFARLKGDSPASLTLAYANLLINFLKANKVNSAKKQREIINALRNAATDLKNIRLLSHLGGSGSTNSPRRVVHDGRLDQALLAVIGKSYSVFFANV
ncbi:NACHT domain-containing protein [Mucilaginibacter celer]|uniref:NACHT domain-containing protein n=1 Tax=Mucilaginibacter celer TaxID=2305508 RepID=A0A494VWS4_9SPHI|nr:hypothetical protein [Mucilaginibacter celer]AYL97930.1 hypothetical protein HYN43_022720 [Mucilaginibacter celer]